MIVLRSLGLLILNIDCKLAHLDVALTSKSGLFARSELTLRAYQ